MVKRPYSAQSTSSSPSTSPSTYQNDSSDIDELDHRSRRLTNILKKNVARSEKRKTVLDVVRDKAWLLEDQVKLLEKQTANVRSTLVRQSCRRKIIVFAAVILSLILILNRSIFSGLYDIMDKILHKTRREPKVY